jgi:hypothetical protein
LGAVGTPSYTFTGDTNTGMWSPAADTIAFSEGGTEAMRINSSGNVGIGTSSPAERLTVNSATSEFAIQWSGPGNEWVLGSAATRSYIRNKTASVETLTILNAGEVGIGTSPDANAKLDVAGTVRSGAGGSDPGTGAAFYLVGSGSFQTVIGGAAFAVNTGANNARTERIRIDASGNVGIGTSAPLQLLQVHGSSGSDVYMRVSNTDSGTGSGLLMGLDGNEAGVIRLETNQPLSFGTNNAERMRIDSSGNVGIGTSTFGTSAVTVIGIANGTAPTTSPAGMGQLYVEGGALKYRGSSGTVTTIANA